MTIVLDSHKRIRSGEVAPKLSKKGPPVVLEVYSVEDAKKSPSVQGELVANCETELPRAEFPVLLLELCGKYPGEEGPQVVTHLCARRIVTVDLEDEDDWGDVNWFWTGTEMAWGLGNDVDGYWKIVRAFEMMEPQDELHELKLPVVCELTMAELRELIEARAASW